MPNKHFCQGPTCHEQTTQDRFLKSRGVVRGRYAYCDRDVNNGWRHGNSDKYFCSQSCKLSWLSVNMENIEQGRPIEFIRHRRESGGTQNLWYEKKTETHQNTWSGGTYTTSQIRKIERVDNSTEID
jgi:hypothetical protein